MFRGAVQPFHLLILLLILIPLALWVWSLIAEISRPDWQWQAAGHSKILYVLLTIFLGLLGSLLYALIARPGLQRVAQQVPTNRMQYPQQ